MADAGEIKAKVTIEYDGSGVEQAKKDLASLAEAAGSVGEGTGSASEGLSALDEQASKSAGSVQGLSSAFADLPKIAEKSGQAFSTFGEGAAQSQGAIDGMVASVEEVQAPLEKTSSLLEKTAAPMAMISEHAQAVDQGFAQIGDSLTYSAPLLSQYADSMQNVVESTLAPNPAHLAENMAVFQDALANPYPFQMMQQHLNETGQTWGDFTSAIGSDNTAMLHEMATTSDQTHAVLGGMSSDAQSVGKTFTESAGSAGAFTEQFNAMGAAASDVNKAVEETGSVVADAGKAMEGAGFGEVFSGAMSGVGGFIGGTMEALNSIAMPLMAVQMIGMAVGTAAKGIYDMAATAEGPAAHSMGTFTGAVDTLGASVKGAGQQFSESFGQGLLGTLGAINDVAGPGKGGNFWGDVGSTLGFMSGSIVNAGEYLIGAPLAALGLDRQGGMGMVQMASEGFQNQWAQLNQQPLPFPGPNPPQQSQLQQQLAATVATMQAQANDPQLLAAQAYLGSQQAKAVQAQQSYDVSHYTGVTGGPTDPYNAVVQYELNRMNGVGGLTNPDPNAAFFNSLGEPSGCFIAGTRVLMADGSERAIETLQVGDQVLSHDRVSFTPTTVLALITPPPKKVYDLSFDDGKTLTLTDSHPISTAEGWKSLHPRATQEENPGLAVSTLHIGDRVHTTGHMVTLVGIRPGEVVQIYNITVDEPHTFYANAILVHNKALGGSSGTSGDIGSQISGMIGSIQLPHIDLSGMTSSLAGSFSGIQLPHLDLSGLTSGLAGSFSGIQLPHLDLSGLTSGLSGSFSGIQLPHLDLSGITSGLSGAFSGIQLPHIDLSGVAAGLSGAFSGIQLPSIPEIGSQISGQLGSMFAGIQIPSIPEIGGQISGQLGNMFSGIQVPSVPQIGGMISSELGSIFSGISLPSVPDIGKELNGAMGGIFSGISMPPIPNIGGMINGALSGMFSGISMPSVPFFASGVENFGGGAAVIADNGPELVMLPNGSSVYPLSAGGSTGANMTPVSLSGGGGSNTPQSINVSVHLDGQAIISTIGLPLSQNIRLASGMRGF